VAAPNGCERPIRRCDSGNDLLRMVDAERQPAILRAINEAEGSTRSLVSISDLADWSRPGSGCPRAR
jgi:hypothetical protein